MVSAAQRKAQEEKAAEAEPPSEEEGKAPKAAAAFYVATRDLFIQGVPAHRIGDTVPAEHVARYGWGHGVEDPGEEG